MLQVRQEQVDNAGLRAATQQGWHRKVQSHHVKQDPVPTADREALAVVAARGRSMGDQNAVDGRVTPKVAFLFLAMHGIWHERIWDSFFEGAPHGAFSAYVHRAEVGRDRAQGPGLPLARWGVRAVPTVPSAWCGLLGAMVALLQESLLDAANAQFVFVSHDAVPMKRFAYVYQHLINDTPETSKFCFASSAESLSESSTWCDFRDQYHNADKRVTKHHQWIVLARQHADMVVRNALTAYDVWLPSYLASEPGAGCSDESVPATALLLGLGPGLDVRKDLRRMGVHNSCLTFTAWHECLAGTDLNPRWSNDYDTQICLSTQPDPSPSHNVWPRAFCDIDADYFRRLAAEGFMFARKFEIGSTVKDGLQSMPIEDVLPALWDQINETTAAQHTWSRLDFSGRGELTLKPQQASPP